MERDVANIPRPALARMLRNGYFASEGKLPVELFLFRSGGTLMSRI